MVDQSFLPPWVWSASRWSCAFADFTIKTLVFAEVGLVFTTLRAFLRLLMACLQSSLNQMVLCFVSLGLLLGIVLFAMFARICSNCWSDTPQFISSYPTLVKECLPYICLYKNLSDVRWYNNKSTSHLPLSAWSLGCLWHHRSFHSPRPSVSLVWSSWHSTQLV